MISVENSNGTFRKFVYVISPSAVSIMINHKTISVPKKDYRYTSIVEMCKRQDIDGLMQLGDSFSLLKEAVMKDYRIYNGDKDITGIVNPKLYNFIKLLYKKGVVKEELKRIVPFLQNCLDNPYIDACTEIYDFCKAMDFEITDDGCFLAYKNVRSDLKSIFDGTTQHAVGMITKVDAFDTDRNQTCSKGLHFCSREYLKSYVGDVTIVVKVNPKDVVAIPVDYNFQKGRCRQYETVSIIGKSDYLKDLEEQQLHQSLVREGSMNPKDYIDELEEDEEWDGDILETIEDLMDHGYDKGDADRIASLLGVSVSLVEAYMDHINEN